MRDHHADGEARPDGQCRRHGDLLADDLVAGTADCVLRSFADSCGHVILAFATALNPEVQDRGETCGKEHTAPVVVNRPGFTGE